MKEVVLRFDEVLSQKVSINRLEQVEKYVDRVYLKRAEYEQGTKAVDD
jgi:hypothetical protein